MNNSKSDREAIAQEDSHQSAQTQEGPFRTPEQWKTGDEPITAAQKSYLTTLATEAGEPHDDIDSLTKAEAAIRIDELQVQTGRGK